MKIKVWFLFLLILSSCKDVAAVNANDCVVIIGPREFKESDLVKLKAEAPATLTRNGSARLSEVSMKDRLLTKLSLRNFPIQILDYANLTK